MSPLALVIENDAGTRKLLDVLLTRFRCEVDAVGNGSDALELLEHIDYDLIVVDLVTPGASGTNIVDWLRAHRPEALARTAMLSSAPAPIAQRIRDAYPTLRVIRKPFELTEIVEFVERVRPHFERAPIPAAGRFSRRSIAAGAKSGVLVRTAGSHLELVHEFGHGPQIEAWFPMAATEHVPLCNCVRDGRARWIASPAVAAREYPHLLQIWLQNQSCAVATVPVLRDGVVRGAAGWTFREPHSFDENEQRAFTAIADEAGDALFGGESGDPSRA